jgi:hypothetical protein
MYRFSLRRFNFLKSAVHLKSYKGKREISFSVSFFSLMMCCCRFIKSLVWVKMSWGARGQTVQQTQLRPSFQCILQLTPAARCPWKCAGSVPLKRDWPGCAQCEAKSCPDSPSPAWPGWESWAWRTCPCHPSCHDSGRCSWQDYLKISVWFFEVFPHHI